MRRPAGTSAPGSRTANGPTTASAPTDAFRPTVFATTAPGADDGVDQTGGRPDLGPGADNRAALEDRARKQGDVGRQLDGDVDVGVLGIEHRHAGREPGPVGAAPQLDLRRGELHTVVDPLHLGRIVDDDDELTG